MTEKNDMPDDNRFALVVTKSGEIFVGECASIDGFAITFDSAVEVTIKDFYEYTHFATDIGCIVQSGATISLPVKLKVSVNFFYVITKEVYNYIFTLPIKLWNDIESSGSGDYTYENFIKAG